MKSEHRSIFQWRVRRSIRQLNLNTDRFVSPQVQYFQSEMTGINFCRVQADQGAEVNTLPKDVSNRKPKIYTR